MLVVRPLEGDQLEVGAVRERDERIVGADRVLAAGHHREAEIPVDRNGGLELLEHDDQVIDAADRSIGTGGAAEREEAGAAGRDEKRAPRDGHCFSSYRARRAGACDTLGATHKRAPAYHAVSAPRVE